MDLRQFTRPPARRFGRTAACSGIYSIYPLANRGPCRSHSLCRKTCSRTTRGRPHASILKEEQVSRTGVRTHGHCQKNARQWSEQKRDQWGESMTRAALQHMPLTYAYLCQDCESIGNCASQCPACASPALMGLAGVLNRESASTAVLPMQRRTIRRRSTFAARHQTLKTHVNRATEKAIA